MAKCWSDLKRGDPVFTRDGRYCGEVIHVQPNACYIDAGFPAPTLLMGKVMDKSVARHGDMLVFTEANHGRG
jgi:hypothetical protein